MASVPRAHLLIVDDEPVVHAILREALHADRRTMSSAATLAEARALVGAGERVDLALIDKNLPDGSGLEIAHELKERDPFAEVILITGYASFDSAVEALKVGAYDYLTKPFEDINKLALQVEHALQKVQLRRDQERLLAQLVQSERRYALAARGANDGLWDWDLHSGQVYFSPRWREMLGLSEGEVRGVAADWLDRVHDDDRERVEAALHAHLDGRLDHLQDEHRVRHRDGTFRWLLCRAVADRDSQGRPMRLAGSMTDVTERRLAEQQMQYDVLHDAVTFLPNRTLFVDRLGQALARARRHPGCRFAVMLLDLDRFKLVNEGLGHSMGDKLLVSFARRLEGCLRAGDTAARLGGDEFAVLLDEVVSEQDAVAVAERLTAEVSTPVILDGREVFTTVSGGIVMATSTYERPEELLRDADIAMYRAKTTGRGRYVLFETAMQHRAASFLETDTALRRAVERREFVVYYQPIVSLESGRIIGFEALVRWQRPDRGLVPPLEFIPIAEDTGLIIPISEYVLEAAVKQVRAWQTDGVGREQLYVSVNVSGRHLAFPGLVDTVGRLLLDHHLAPASLRLEITESAIVENTAAVELTLAKLKGLDVQLYMDDFGTGYSSLSYLHRLPIDTLKVDRAFVTNLGKEGENSVIVHTIVTLARVLGIEVIAEGIETADQLSHLRALRCDHGQGYLFARPLPAEAITELLRRNPEW